MAIAINFNPLRDRIVYAATFWKDFAVCHGVRVTLRGMPHSVRFGLLTGEYEWDDVALCRDVLRSDDRIVEIGSAIGMIGLYCMQVIGVRDYAMVEANPDVIALAQDNFRANGIAPPPILNQAVSDRRGEVAFNIGEVFVSSSIRAIRRNARQIVVDGRRIPEIVAQLGFTPNVLIMDIEGYEADLPVEDFARFDKIIIELHGRFIGQDRIDAFEASLHALGFVEAAAYGHSKAFTRTTAPTGQKA